MPQPVVAAVELESIIMLLVWAVWVVLNLWIWQKAKSNGNLVMLVGAALLALSSLLMLLGSYSSVGAIMMIGSVVLTIGFYISVKPMVAAQLAALQSKVKHMTESKPGDGAGGGTPPAAS